LKCHGNSVSSEENHMGGAGTAICLVRRAALSSGQRGLKAAHLRKPDSLTGRSHFLWCIEYSGIPQRQVPKCSGRAYSTVWR
jgi:hypothetical protein